MQQAALLQRMVGHVFMLVRQHRPTAQQGIAMFAVAGEGVGAVHHRVAQGRQKLGLRHRGPMRKAARLAPIEAPDFLQAHNVGIQLLHSMPQVVNLQALRRPQALNAFVNVVSGNAQQTHGRILSQRPAKA